MYCPNNHTSFSKVLVHRLVTVWEMITCNSVGSTNDYRIFFFLLSSLKIYLPKPFSWNAVRPSRFESAGRSPGNGSHQTGIASFTWTHHPYSQQQKCFRACETSPCQLHLLPWSSHTRISPISVLKRISILHWQFQISRSAYVPLINTRRCFIMFSIVLLLIILGYNWIKVRNWEKNADQQKLVNI